MAAISIAGCTETLSEQVASDDGGDRSPNESNEGDTGEETDEDTEDLPEERLLFDFQDLHEWDLAEGALSPDRENYITGELSARLDGDRDPVVRIDRADLNLDLSVYRPSITVRLHTSAPTQTVDIIATDTDDNDMRFRTRFYKTDEETTFMPLDLGIHEYDDEVDLSSIESLRIQTRFGEEESGTLWVDSVHLTPIPRTPKLMIQWDDGFESQYTNALPIQHEYDIPSTTFINTANLGDGRVTVEQLDELQDHGWEIGSHMMTHDNIRDLSEQEQEAQIRGAQDWLIDNGFEEGAEFFAYTYGEYDQSGYDIVEEYHTYAMIGGNPGYGLPRSPAHVGRSSERTLEDAEAYIETLIRWGGIGALFWHEIPGETPVDEFDAIMSLIADYRDAGDLDVITLSDLAELQGRELGG